MENESGFKHLTSQKGSFWGKHLLPVDYDEFFLHALPLPHWFAPQHGIERI